jgi:uncharacterized protein YbcI
VPDESKLPPATSSMVAEVSREIVRIYARYYGRGPTKAKTIFHGDLVVTMLEEIYTKAELLLVDTDHFDRVRAQRQAFQDEIEPMFRGVVERASGRTVRAFLSQVTEEGIAAEVFVLMPVAETSIDPPVRA